jgi:hypothetical protein
MLYERFDSNFNLDLHSKQMMRGNSVKWDGPGHLSAHADMDDFPGSSYAFSLCGAPGSSNRLGPRGMQSVKDSWPFPLF